MNRCCRAPRIRASAALCGLLGATLFVAARSASADPNIPAYIQNKYALPCAPDCTLCHANDRGGYANFRTITINGAQKGGFGVTMKNLGLNPIDPSTWDPAFAAADSKNTDTDADGIADIDEIMRVQDPNNPATGAALCSPPSNSSGCAMAQRASGGRVAPVASAVALLAGIALYRLRSTRHSSGVDSASSSRSRP